MTTVEIEPNFGAQYNASHFANTANDGWAQQHNPGASDDLTATDPTAWTYASSGVPKPTVISALSWRRLS